MWETPHMTEWYAYDKYGNLIAKHDRHIELIRLVRWCPRVIYVEKEKTESVELNESRRRLQGMDTPERRTQVSAPPSGEQIRRPRVQGGFDVQSLHRTRQQEYAL